ncbi:glycosyltransferase [Luteimonas deserti]|uniref:glycosyltransferase n=1 Tax=Luteimonas deserti TaxID=2752306 RepID=UPI001C5CB188|nr:glycosyltransferase [Luteimonas deserti]
MGPQAFSAAFAPQHADALFLGGMDWLAYPQDAGRPVINLVQHVRHGDPAHPLSDFLQRRAIRICVSQPVADAILATGRVNGPVRVINAALNLPSIPESVTRCGIFIDAIKQPELGRHIALGLAGLGDVTLSDTRLPRIDYARALARAEIAILLPHATEGFYLPALEAMASGCAVVVPDCIGNRAYLVPGLNALAPALAPDAIVAAVRRLVEEPGLRARIADAGGCTASGFGLAAERTAFHALLDSLDTIWGHA